MRRSLILTSALAALLAAPMAAKAVEAPPGFASAYLSGLIAERRGETEIAADRLATALDIAPGTPALQRRVMRLRLAEGSFEAASKAAESLAKAGDDNFPIGLIRLAERFRTGDYAGALKLTEDPRANGLSTVVALLAKSWAEAGAGQVDAGTKALTDAAKEMQGLNVLLLLHAALLNDQADRTDVARWLYEEAMTAAEADDRAMSPRLILAVASFFERQDMADVAAEIRAKAEGGFAPPPTSDPIVASPAEGLAEALFNFAGSLFGDRQHAQALIYARLSEALRPEDPALRFTIAQILEATGRHMAAAEAYGAVPRVGSYAWRAPMRAAESLADSGDRDAGIAALRAVLEVETKEPQLAINLGHMLRGASRFEEAVEAYDEAIRRKGGLGPDDGWLRYARGVALERSGRWDEAEQEFLTALETLGDEPLILNYLGYTWIDRGENLERATAMVARAVELRPEDGFIRDSLGWAEFRAGEYEKAVATLERAIEIQPVDPVINDHLGDAYWKVGRIREAKFLWRRALSFEPEEKQVPIIEEKLKCGLDGCPEAAAAPAKPDGDGG